MIAYVPSTLPLTVTNTNITTGKLVCYHCGLYPTVYSSVRVVYVHDDVLAHAQGMKGAARPCIAHALTRDHCQATSKHRLPLPSRLPCIVGADNEYSNQFDISYANGTESVVLR